MGILKHFPPSKVLTNPVKIGPKDLYYPADEEFLKEIYPPRTKRVQYRSIDDPWEIIDECDSNGRGGIRGV